MLLWHMQTTHFLLIWQQQKVSRGLSNLIMRGLCYAQLCRLRSGHGFIPCCEIWLLPEALWKSCFLLCSTMCKPPCWEKQGILLNCIHLFLSLTIWNREKWICRAIFPSYFFISERELGWSPIHSLECVDWWSQ